MTCPGDTAALGDIAEFIRGITFKPDDVVPSGTSGSVRCMRTKNVQAEIDLSDVWSVDSRFVKRANQYLQAGDLLVSSANSWNLVGKCCWVPEEVSGSTFGGFISALRTNRERVDPRYLYHWFSSDRIQTTVRSFGRQTTNISNLDFTRCLSLSVPLPSLDRQRWVSQVLDSVDALRAKRRTAITLLDDLTQSVFLDMFSDVSPGWITWPVHELRTMCSVITKGTTPTSVGLSFATNGIPFLKVQNLQNGTIVFGKNDLYIDHLSHRTLKRSRVIPGDILISIAGTVGRSAIVPSLPGEMNCNQAVAIIRLLESSQRRYIREWLASCDAISQITSSSVTATISNLSLEQLGSLKLRMPSVELQEEFSRKLESIDSLKSSYQSSLAELDALFASLQRRAFCGELWGNSPAV